MARSNTEKRWRFKAIYTFRFCGWFQANGSWFLWPILGEGIGAAGVGETWLWRLPKAWGPHLHLEVLFSESQQMSVKWWRLRLYLIHGGQINTGIVKRHTTSLDSCALITALVANLQCDTFSLSDGFLAHLLLPTHSGISRMPREFLLVTVDD